MTTREVAFDLLEDLPIGVFVLDARGRPAYGNRMAVELLGQVVDPPPGDVDLAETYQVYVAGTDQLYQQDRMPVVQALQGISGHADDFEIRRPDGSRLLVEAWAAPILGADGRVEWAVAAFLEISKRRQLERESAELAAIVGSSSDAVYSLRPDLTVSSWNAAATELYGYTAEEMVGTPVSVLYPVDVRAAESEIARSVLEGYVVEHYETTRMTSERVPIEISLTMSPVRNADGEVVGVSAIARDVSLKKRAEEALRSAFQQEAMARRQLESTDRMRSAFVEALAHDIRSPLTVIVSGIDLVRRRAGELDKETVGQLLENAEAAASRLQALVTDLIDLDALATRTVKARPVETDLRALVDDVLRGLARELSGHELACEVSEGPALVDPDHARRIVHHLVRNAAVHTGPDTRIWVRLTRVREGLLIAVDDAGPGVAPDLGLQVFEPFRTGASEARGTGAGLALVAGYAALHKGRAWVEEREGGGAAFRVLLSTAGAA